MSVTVDRAGFFSRYRRIYGKISKAKVVGIEFLLDQFEDADWSLRQVAYMLATVKHECADRWTPVTEFGSRDYFDKYGPSTDLGRRLGNTAPDDGYVFRGRGYVQITGRANYERMSSYVGVDLVANPDLALIPAMSYEIMSNGLQHGLFTGHALAEFIHDDVVDYVHARRTINGMNEALRIAGYAEHLESCLQENDHGQLLGRVPTTT